MAKITTSIDKKLNLTIQTVIGKILAKEISETIITYYKGESTKLILWDFTDADTSAINSSEIQEIMNITKNYAELRPNGKTAMVFSSDLGFGLGRMFDIQQEIYKPNVVSHRSFRDKELALKWLLEE